MVPTTANQFCVCGMGFIGSYRACRTGSLFSFIETIISRKRIRDSARRCFSGWGTTLNAKSLRTDSTRLVTLEVASSKDGKSENSKKNYSRRSNKSKLLKVYPFKKLRRKMHFSALLLQQRTWGSLNFFQSVGMTMFLEDVPQE